MAIISQDNQVTTLINVFVTAKDQQKSLAGDLIKATEDVMRHMPGFISANIHCSTDGVRVVNYAQWKSENDLNNAIMDPEALKHIQAISAVHKPDAHTYDIVHSYERDKPTVISTDYAGVTAINVVHTTPDKQKRLTELMIKNGEGFSQATTNRSFNLHSSRDGSRNVNYIQADDVRVLQEGLKRLIAAPEAQER